ncbi:hypothetical protein PARU111607_16065 [Palleronia rufa]
MFTGMILAAVLGGLALPELMRLGDDDEEAEAAPDLPDGRNGDLLTTASGNPDGTGDPGAGPTGAGDSAAGPGNAGSDAALHPDAVQAGAAPGDAEAWLDPASGDAPAELPDELDVVEIDPGVHDVLDFDPDSDALVVQVPLNTTGYLTHPGNDTVDPPLPPSLTFEVPDGAVTMRFPGLSAVPADAVSIRGDDGASIPLTDLLLDGAGGLTAENGEAAASPEGYSCAVPSDAGPDLAGVAAGADASIVPAPTDTVSGPAADGAEIEEDRPPTVAVQQVVSEEIVDQGDPSALIRFFDKGADILRVETDLDGEVSVRPSEGGDEAQIWIGNMQVANVQNAPDFSLDDLDVIRAPQSIDWTSTVR